MLQTIGSMIFTAEGGRRRQRIVCNRQCELLALLLAKLLLILLFAPRVGVLTAAAVEGMAACSNIHVKGGGRQVISDDVSFELQRGMSVVMEALVAKRVMQDSWLVSPCCHLCKLHGSSLELMPEKRGNNFLPLIKRIQGQGVLQEGCAGKDVRQGTLSSLMWA